MALRINFNFEAAATHTSLVSNERDMNKSLLRLSTGMRILNASDDAAGLFIADQLSLVATGYREGNRNIQTGLSALRIAENAAGQIFDRLKEIYARATRAANDINDPNARASLQAEIRNFVDAIQKIGTDTEYNGIKLLDGTFSDKYIHYGPRNDQIVNVSIQDLRAQSIGTNLVSGTGSVTSSTGALNNTNFPYQVYTGSQTALINGRSLTMTAGSNNIIDAGTFAKNINEDPTLGELGFKAYAKNSSTAAQFTSLIVSDGTNESASLTFYVGGVNFTVSGVNESTTLDDLISRINSAAANAGAQVRASKTVDNRLVLNTTNGETIAVEASATATGTGVTITLNLDQLIQGASSHTSAAGNNPSFTASAVRVGQIKITAPDAYRVDFQSANNARGLGIGNVTYKDSDVQDLYKIDVRTNEGAELGMIIADAAIRKVDRIRSNIGAIMNNLQSIYDAQKVALDNTQEAENVIRNTDYAEEMTNFTKLQIKMQSGMAMLAQANQLPQLVLQLLR